MVLGLFESTSEIFVILVVALVIFGPRKLPQLSRTIGKGLGEFKRASEEFKRTWEQEADIENRLQQESIVRPLLAQDEATISATAESGQVLHAGIARQDVIEASATLLHAPPVMATPLTARQLRAAVAEVPTAELANKQDWL
jgi:TatA/E family protein of Tat protein translocase